MSEAVPERVESETAASEPVVHVHLGPVPVEAEVGEPLRGCEFVVVDVETTGGSAQRGDRITEIAAIRMRGDGTVVEELVTLVNPCRPIPRYITALTNITDAMVRDAPRFSDIAREVQRVLDGAVFVAHNAPFDRRFVSAELEWCTGFPLRARVLCTLRLARKLVPEVSSRSLGALTYYFGIENEARHRAYGDARATATLLGRLLERLEEREVWSWEGLEGLMSARKARPRRRANPQPMDRA